MKPGLLAAVGGKKEGVAMRLVIDCFKLVKGLGKSIGIYNLAKNLTAHLAQTNQNGEHCEEIVVLGNEWNRKDFDIPGVRFVQMKGNPKSKLYCMVWELFLVPFAARRFQADRLLFPRGYRPLFYRGKEIVIIHDLIPFYYDKHFPGVLNRVENAYIMSRVKASMKHAHRIVTISEFSRKEVDEMCPGSGSRVRVNYNGINSVARAEGDCSLKPDGPYFYAAASGLPHKNAIGVLRAYEAYYKQAKEPARLVLVGIDSPERIDGGEQLPAEVKESITCYRYIESAEEMHSLMAGARAFLFLSLIEGFGFPPLEAMQLGVPVICSNRTALPEVIGDAGLLVDPDDRSGIVACMNRLLEDEKLREELIAKGYENVKRFDWDSRTRLYWEVLTE